MPKIIAAVVMMIGRIRTSPPGRASGTVRPARRPVGEVDEQDRVLVTRPISITRPIIENRLSVERVTGGRA
jgi:hypothetical protein